MQTRILHGNPLQLPRSNSYACVRQAISHQAFSNSMRHYLESCLPAGLPFWRPKKTDRSFFKGARPMHLKTRKLIWTRRVNHHGLTLFCLGRIAQTLSDAPLFCIVCASMLKHAFLA